MCGQHENPLLSLLGVEVLGSSRLARSVMRVSPPLEGKTDDQGALLAQRLALGDGKGCLQCRRLVQP